MTGATVVERADQAKIDGSTVGRGKKAPARTYISGHCSTGAMVDEGLIATGAGGGSRQWHTNCKASLVNGDGSILICSCECHGNHTVCRDCGRVDVPVVTEGKLTGTCLDPADCAEVLAARSLASPLRQYTTLLQEAAISKRVAGRVPAGAVPQAPQTQQKAPDRPRSTATTPREPKRCHCGCDAMTKGGSFVVGHDAKLKGRLLTALRGEVHEVRVMAAAEALARGWLPGKIDTDLANDAMHHYGTDLQATIDHFTNKRYSGG